jgi:hydroxyethylthiazole kinase-like uncharacterized protein yjeF
MRNIDRLAAEKYGVTGMELMERAGMAVFEEARRMLEERRGSRAVIVCGRGNNGGDGFVVARLLACSGYQPRVLLAGRADALKGDAAANYKRAVTAGVPIQEVEDVPPHLPPCDIVVDALLGTGLQSDVEGLFAELVRLMNEHPAPVLSVDIPSGLDSDAGVPRGACVRADATVTLGLPKVGMVVFPGVEYVGRLLVADIGIPAPLLEGKDPEQPLNLNLVTPEMVRDWLPPLEATTHKGARGTVLVVAGSIGFTGAAVLTSEGALRAGAGLVFLACPKSLNPIYEVKLTEVITRPVPEPDVAGCFGPESVDTLLQEVSRADALAVGPGLSTAQPASDMLAAFLPKVQVPTVLDADGLNILAARPEITLPPECVLTPHPGEMGRLMGMAAKEVQESRIRIAREAAYRFERIVVLKGGATVVAEPAGEAYINPTGNSGMATGGTGDVLTGAIAALMARGMAPIKAAVAGVYLHGLAGDLVAEELGREGMAAGDLLLKLPLAFRRVRGV